MKAGIYIRMSTYQSQDGTSHDAHEELCRELSERIGCEVVEEYVWVDLGSGKDLDRPMLSAMREAVRRRKVEVVVVYSPDRLSRNPLHLPMLLHEFQDTGVSLHFVKGNLEGAPEGHSVVKAIFQWASEGVSVYQIAERLNRLNISGNTG